MPVQSSSGSYFATQSRTALLQGNEQTVAETAPSPASTSTPVLGATVYGVVKSGSSTSIVALTLDEHAAVEKQVSLPSDWIYPGAVLASSRMCLLKELMGRVFYSPADAQAYGCFTSTDGAAYDLCKFDPTSTAGTVISAVNEIRLSGYYGNGQWANIRTISPVFTDKDGETITLQASDFSLTFHSLKTELYRSYGSGALIIDDISVTHADTSAAGLSDYNARSAGGNLSMRVSGLDPDIHYRYEEKVSNDSLMSAASLPRSMRTASSVSVYTSSGMLFHSSHVSAQDSPRLHLPARGIYIVRISTRS